MDNSIKAFEATRAHVVELNVRWSAFLELFTKSDTQMQLLDKAATGFFKIVHDAIRDTTFMAIARLLDPAQTGNKANLSIEGVLNQLDGEVPEDSLKGLREQLAEAQAHCENIREWRNQWLAHIDANLALGTTKDSMPGVMRGQMDECVQMINQIINELEQVLGRPATPFQGYQYRGTPKDLIRILENWNDNV